MPVITIDEMERLKREAWKIKKQSGRKHAEVLDELAVKLGYNNWSMLHQDVIRKQAAEESRQQREYRDGVE